jgi:hypothetical protein
MGELIAHNYRAGALPLRQKAMLDFAVRLTEAPDKIAEADRKALHRAGFSDRDIWDIAAVAAFYNMSNRLAAAVGLEPNREYHHMARQMVREGVGGAANAQLGSIAAALGNRTDEEPRGRRRRPRAV